MGDPKKCRKKYARPRHPWKQLRIDEEKTILKDYGLKNHREIWRHKTQLRDFRGRARKISGLRGERAQLARTELFSKLQRLGILTKKEPTLDDVLCLTLKDILERRLQTVIFRQSMAHTERQARQFITHGHIAVNGKKVSVPSYLVAKSFEPTISFLSFSKISKAHVSVPKVVASAGAPEAAVVQEAPGAEPQAKESESE